MKRLALVPFLLAAICCKPKDGIPVEIKGTKFYAFLVRSRQDFKKFLRARPPGDEQCHVVAFSSPRYQHYETSYSYDVVFTDASGKIVDVQLLAATPDGITSEAEATHAFFFSSGVASRLGLKSGETIALPAALRENLPPLLAELTVNGNAVHAETQVTHEEQQRGFMYWKRLSADDGKIFVYDREDSHDFWMKNCVIDLDIAFFRADGTLINVVETRRYPDPSHPPANRHSSALEPAQYVLETNYGWFRAKGLIRDDGLPNGVVKLEVPADVAK